MLFSNPYAPSLYLLLLRCFLGGTFSIALFFPISGQSEIYQGFIEGFCRKSSTHNFNFFLRSCTNSWYFVLFLSLVSFPLFSQTAVNSRIIICFVELGTMTTSGRKVISTTWSENFSWFSQIYLHWLLMKAFSVLLSVLCVCVCVFSLALTNCTVCLFGFRLLA